jgi:molybdopterin molybdotransferase
MSSQRRPLRGDRRKSTAPKKKTPAKPPARARRRRKARLGADLAPNGPREHYMRAEVFPTGEVPEIVPFGAQDSSLLSILSRANGLLVRPVGDPERKAGELVDYVPIGPIAT